MRGSAASRRVRRSSARPALLCPLLLLIIPCTGCPPPPDGDGGAMNGFANTTDMSNQGAAFVGSSACRQCHSQIGAWHRLHGHAHQLTPVVDGAPRFPAAAERAGVPDPPGGFEWAEISWLIGGYRKVARFLDQSGFVLTTGVEGVNTQWNLDFPPNGTTAGFAPYEPDRDTPKPYDFSCFQCHTTGPMPQDPDVPEFQENRRGILGTWHEVGIQCEACHGPGSNHFSTDGGTVVIDRSSIFISSTGAETCNTCHNRRDGAPQGVIRAEGGFIAPEQQVAELRASGGHSQFACTFCHDPHRSVTYDRTEAIRNECTACHPDQTMALHEGFVFRRGDYVEPLSCESCHMTFATRIGSSAPPDVVGEDAHMGDTRTHIFRIRPEPVDFTSMFAADLGSVVKDEQGRAAVTLDFVCLRCHSGVGNAFQLRVDVAALIAEGMHGK
jgi:hypothetical protein